MIDNIANGESGLSARTKINQAFAILNTGCVLGGTEIPVADPGTDFAIYIQKPLGAEYLWFDGEWHFKG